jgi:hypothetical protein
MLVLTSTLNWPVAKRRQGGPRQGEPGGRIQAGPEHAALYDGVAIDTPEGIAEQERGREFVRLFNELDHHIKRMTQSVGGEGFFRRLQWAARDQPQIKRYIDDLMEFAELRNALVHDRRFPNRLIAVPTEETITAFRRVVEHLVRPRRVIPAFACDLRVFAPTEPLTAALEYMHRGGYTQVIVREAGELRLLTAAGITRWLAAGLGTFPVGTGVSPSGVGTGVSLSALPADALTGVPTADRLTAVPRGVSLAIATIADALAFDKPEALALIEASATVEEAVDMFQQAVAKRRVRLFAILITQTGLSNEAPLGIITPADLLDEE